MVRVFSFATTESSDSAEARDRDRYAILVLAGPLDIIGRIAGSAALDALIEQRKQPVESRRWNDKGVQDRKFAWHILLVKRHAGPALKGPGRWIKRSPIGLRKARHGNSPPSAARGKAVRKKAGKCMFPAGEFSTAVGGNFCCSRRSRTQQRMSIMPPLATSAGSGSADAPALRRRPAPAQLGNCAVGRHGRWDLHCTWDARTWRNNLRLTSALVLLSFVICHLLAHSLLIVSFGCCRRRLRRHYVCVANRRRHRAAACRLPCPLRQRAVVDLCAAVAAACRRGNGSQIGLGLSIPLLLMTHVIGTRIADSSLDVIGSTNRS